MKFHEKHELGSFPDDRIIDLLLETRHSGYFEELYDRYALKVFQKCLSFTKNEEEAKDVAHDVILKIYLKLSGFNKKSKFSTWVYAITYNHCVDHQAKQKKMMNMAEEIRLEEESDLNKSPTDTEILGLSVETLYLLLEELSPTEKSLLLMKYQDGFSIKEIAELTGSGVSAVKMKLKRTKTKLMDIYGQEK
ncbi:RNA polymerase sigma factor [Ekhidna sp. To15]|uniref:RNA polymerase sigma factor n=1 Tax=Ekhidna sp. To15 TaxID=3395267 RepID=UPI003F5230A2